MSHISTVKMIIRDVDALAEAARMCGCELRTEQKTFRTFGGRKSACEAAIVAPGGKAFEVGILRGRWDEAKECVVADPAGDAYMLEYDLWCGGDGLEEHVGKKCLRLLRNYGVAATTNVAKANGWAYRQEERKDGSIRLYCTPKKQWATATAKTW